MSTCPRPELLAAPDWLADNMGRPEIRIVDVRWRPDGSGRGVFAAGHVPGATYLDWANELVDTEDERGLFCWPAPSRRPRR